jgi:signal peptidase I
VNKKGKNLAKKCINILLNAVIALLGIVLLISIYTSFQIKILNKGYADIFGYSLFDVQTGSMSGTIEAGDWIIIELTKDVKINDIITYKKDEDYIFPANNKYGHLKDHRKAIRQISKDCGVEFSLHDLRRTFASIVENDIGLHVSEYLQNRLLNHAQTDVHGKHYIRFEIERLKPIMQDVEDYILVKAGIKEKNNAEIVDIEEAKKVN